MVALHVCGFSLKYLYRDCLSWLWLLNLFALRGVKTLKIHQNLNMTVYIFGYCWHRKLHLVFPFGLLILEIAPPPCPTTAYMSLIWLIFHLFGFFFLNASHQLSSCITLKCWDVYNSHIVSLIQISGWFRWREIGKTQKRYKQLDTVEPRELDAAEPKATYQ